jgi:uncharacterized 2Fe-2S/4Fe-4S cluster protein (DUF4445 family)
MLTAQVIYQHKSGTIIVDPSRTLAQNLFMQGFLKGVPLCAGIGTCGKCAVLFHDNPPKPSTKDQEYFSLQELNQGFRLGCSHYPGPGQSYEVSDFEAPSGFSWVSQDIPVCLGIDIGTTSIKWGFKHSSGLESPGEMINPQMGAGPEIISRMSFARENPGNFNLLRNLLVQELESILDLGRVKDDSICIAGNPAMIYFLLGRDISGLSVSPYSLDYTGGTSESLRSGAARFFIPCLWSPFVGADISSGLGWILEKIRPSYPFLLADFGTNGELVLAISPRKYIVTSVALGPALEGIGLKFGSPYREGVASSFVLSDQGLAAKDSWLGDRVSGSGYISLLAHLVRLKIISASGHFIQGPSPISRRIFSRIRDGRLSLGENFYLDGRDIEEILKAKAAFTLALSFLCAQGAILPDKLQAIYISGALGQHSNLSDLEALGFFPRGSSLKSHVVGNTSLKGAILLACDKDKREENISLAPYIQPVNLGARQEYISGQFAKHMAFEYPH